MKTFLDRVRCLFEQFGRTAERDADVAVALRTEDAAGGQEHVGLLHHLVRECEAVALVALGQLGPHEQARLSLAVAASQRVEQFVSLLLAASLLPGKRNRRYLVPCLYGYAIC